MRYDIPFKPTYKPFYHELSWGFDLKNIHNDLSFLSAQQAIDFTLATLDPTALTVFYKEPAVIIPDVVNKVVNLTQLYLGYRFTQQWKTNRLECSLESYWSPGKWISHQNDSNFSQYHPGAVNHYVFGLLRIKDTWTLPRDFSFKFSFRGQISNENLIPSEQVGLGGYDTVRGYDEREVNYDDAVCVNVEFHLPSFQVLRFIKKYPDALTFLGFFDFGTGRNVHGYGEEQWQKLVSAGPGFRYKITDHLTARFDWGFRLHKIEFKGLGNKVHFGVMASF
jgi:hemolysin activation/secretion protein